MYTIFHMLKMITAQRRSQWMTALASILLSVTISGCGGGGGGGGGDSKKPNAQADQSDNSNQVQENSYSTVDIHLGFEGEVSADRINFPIFIPATPDNWRLLGNEFHQLGELVYLWDEAQSGNTLLPETRNTPILGVDIDTSVFTRHIEIIRTSWEEVGEKCGYGSQGLPNNGCAYNKELPYCTIYVPHQEIYKDGDINAYYSLLGHEMWHCVVGSFH